MELKTSRPEPRVHLAGAYFDDAADWRLPVAQALRRYGLDAFDARRAKTKSGAEDASRITSADFTAYADVRDAHVLLVNLLGAAKLNFNAIQDLAWAYALRKPAVVAIEREGNPHDHPLLSAAMPFRVGSLEEAIEAVAIILNREENPNDTDI